MSLRTFHYSRLLVIDLQAVTGSLELEVEHRSNYRQRNIISPPPPPPALAMPVKTASKRIDIAITKGGLSLIAQNLIFLQRRWIRATRDRRMSQRDETEAELVLKPSNSSV